MSISFDAAALLQRMAATTAREFSYQNRIPGDPLYGAFISPEHWLDESGHVGTTRLIVRWGYLALAQAQKLPGAPTIPVFATLLERLESAVDYLLRVQRPSGLIDLRNTNYESGPDTAFALQLICAFIERARSTPELADIVAKLTLFAQRATVGVDGHLEPPGIRHGRDAEADVTLDGGHRPGSHERRARDHQRPVGSADVGHEEGDEPLPAGQACEQPRPPAGAGQLEGALAACLGLSGPRDLGDAGEPGLSIRHPCGERHQHDAHRVAG